VPIYEYKCENGHVFDVMQKMAEKIPGAAYACLLQTGHLASLEQPEAFNEVVLRFLKMHS